MRRFALALMLLPTVAQAQYTFPNTTPMLCADLAVSIRFAEARDHVRVVFEVRNAGPGAYAGGRGGARLAAALTAPGTADQTQRFDLPALAPGEARSFTLNRAGHAGFAAWGLIEYGAGGGADCNPANNADVKTFAS